MRLFVIGFVLSAAGSVAAAFGAAAHAQVRTFPYEAAVEAEEVEIRSGPGRKYYATSKVERGSHVTVHRHDPGGWYMISPPEGSFSWIPAEHVEPLDNGRGVLTANSVVVRVGSAFSDAHEIEQIRLSKDDAVEILEEKTLQTDRGPARMYKIAPPPGEYRWIPGQFVIPADEVVREQQDRDPFAFPSQARRPEPPESATGNPFAGEDAADETARESQPEDEPAFPSEETGPPRPTEGNDESEDEPALPQFSGNEAGLQTSPDPGRLAKVRNRLIRLDGRFRAIIDQDTGQWDFTQLERDYLQLRQETSHSALQNQVDQRLTALERYQGIKAEYDEFVRLTSETSRREARLLSLQQGEQPLAEPEEPETPPQSTPGPTPVDSQDVADLLPPLPDALEADALEANGGFLPPISRDSRDGGDVFQPAAGPVGMNPAASPDGKETARVRQFEGAGIIQRAPAVPPGLPEHVLIAPDGRILAYLQADQGIDLDRHLGQPMGLHGRRWHRPELRSDFILVRGLTPVRLQPSSPRR